MTSTLRAALDLGRAGRTVRLGEHRDQVAELRVPRGDGPHPVAVVLHGGSWGGRWTRHTTRPLAGALLRLGLATWNVEYRRIGRGGGWPHTLADVAVAIDALADLDVPLDLDRVTVVGHSAGGQLAFWAAARDRLPVGYPGARPHVRATAVVGLAPVTALFPGAAGLLGADRRTDPQRWALADPTLLLPLGIPGLVVHGTADRLLAVAGAERFVRRARAQGDDMSLVRVEGLGHAAAADPRSEAFPPVARWLSARGLVGPATRRSSRFAREVDDRRPSFVPGSPG